MSTWTEARARVAALTRSRTPEDPELIDARRALKAARLEDQIRFTLTGTPALTDEQRDHLAALIRQGVAA